MIESMADTQSTVKGKYLEYKGKPLVREANTICYGDMADPYILLLTILSERTQGAHSVPDRVLVQVLDTDQTKPEPERIVKQDVKKSLFDAFDLGMIWLERAGG